MFKTWVQGVRNVNGPVFECSLASGCLKQRYSQLLTISHRSLSNIIAFNEFSRKIFGGTASNEFEGHNGASVVQLTGDGEPTKVFQ